MYLLGAILLVFASIVEIPAMLLYMLDGMFPGITLPQIFADNVEMISDIAMICTQDKMHYEPALMAIDKGYDILLEKPVAPTPKECFEIGKAATQKGVKFFINPLCYEHRAVGASVTGSAHKTHIFFAVESKTLSTDPAVLAFLLRLNAHKFGYVEL